MAFRFVEPSREVVPGCGQRPGALVSGVRAFALVLVRQHDIREC